MKNLFLFLVIVVCGLQKIKSENINKPISSQYGFIENKGQIIDQNNNPNPTVLYLYNGNGMRVQLRKGGFSYEVIQTVKTPKAIIEKEFHGKFATQADSFDITYKVHRVDINFKEGNKNTNLKAYQPAADFINYYTTGTSEEGVRNVQHFGKVIYENVYPNIDIEFVLDDAANKGKFKYNFIIKPNANLADIQLELLGAHSTNLTKNGNILIETAYGNLEETIPLSYVINENKSHTTIQADFIQLKNNIYGIKAEKYNPSQTLVIDPTNWATYYGGSSSDYSSGVTADKNGKTIITGYTFSATAIATSGSHQVVFNGGTYDAFIAVFNSIGIRLWATYYGGSNSDSGVGIVTDSIGNIILVGDTRSTTSIATVGSHQPSIGGVSNVFIVKFNSNGVRQWGTYFGGNQDMGGKGVAIDTSGNIVVIGTIKRPVNISYDVFILKFNSNGSVLWVSYFGGTGDDNGKGIAINRNSDIIITGNTLSNNSIATTGSHQTVKGGDQDAFIAKFNSSGTRIWATYYGGTNYEEGGGVTTDTSDNIIVTGYSRSTSGIASTGSYQNIFGGDIDAFIAKFNTNGTRLWATYYGGLNSDSGVGIVTDSIGNIIITGTTNSINAIATIGSYSNIIGGNFDSFIAKFNKNGSRLWGTYIGGSNNDQVTSIILDKESNIIIGGITESINSIATIASHQTLYGGSTDAFIAKLNPYGFLGVVSKNIIKGNQTVCNGTIANPIFDSTTVVNLETIKYHWISSIVSADSGFSRLSINDSTANYAPLILNETTYFRRVINLSGVYDTSNCVVVIIGINPSLGFTVNTPTTQCINGNQFIFADTSIISVGLLTRKWNFGEGILDTSSSINPNKTYALANNYSVKLIIDNNGCKDSISHLVTVNPMPRVGFNINTASQCLNGNNFLFTDTSTISSGTLTKKWDFGDGINDTSVLNTPSKIYTNANTYSVKLISISNNNCKDSTTKTITVKPISTSSTNIVVCPSALPYTWNGLIFTSAGSQTKTGLINSLGCDSSATLNLTIKSTSSSTNNLSICPSELPYTWNGLTFTGAGSQTKTGLINIFGCDSSATLNLTIKSTSSSTNNLSICPSSLPYSWNGLTFTGAGSQTKTGLINAVGCDSSATLNLTVNLTPVTGNIVGLATVERLDTASYSVTSTNGSVYNWVVTKGTIQFGFGNNTIQVKWNLAGIDTVKVIETSDQGCIGIQKTFSVNIGPATGINTINISNNITIYPNPFNETINITLSSKLVLKNVIIYDLLGKEIITTNKNVLDVRDLKSGIYLIQVIDNNGNMHNQKLIKN